MSVRNMKIGAAICAAGILMTLICQAGARVGGRGTFLIWAGAIGFGAIRFFVGLANYRRR